MRTSWLRRTEPYEFGGFIHFVRNLEFSETLIPGFRCYRALKFANKLSRSAQFDCGHGMPAAQIVSSVNFNFEFELSTPSHCVLVDRERNHVVMGAIS
jgi:hypothetical protein